LSKIGRGLGCFVVIARVRWLFFCVAGCCSLCGAAVTEAEAAPPGVYRGSYVEVEHVGYLQLCNSHESLKVAAGAAGAELSMIYAALATPEARNTFVEVRGSHRGGTLVVNELERIQTDGPGCKEVMRNSLFKAFGSQPVWNLYIDPTGVRMRTLAEGVPVGFPYHKYWRREGAWVFDSHNAKGDIHIELQRKRCIDAPSGGRFGFTADVTYGEKHYLGCAYPGNLFR
jgi:uncharacterized membrane protein